MDHEYFGSLAKLMKPSGFTLTLQETQSIHASMNIQKLNLLLISIFYYKYLKSRNYL